MPLHSSMWNIVLVASGGASYRAKGSSLPSFCFIPSLIFVGLIFYELKQIALIRCYNLRLKCSTVYFFCGSATDAAGGAYSAPQTH